MKKLALWFANCIWWPIWSNIRWSKERKIVCEAKEEHKATNLTQIKALVKTLYANFKWTKDGADQLWDSVCPPAYNYKRWTEGVLKDDCDGFHSLVYHCLASSGVECYLLCATHMKGGHCILLLKNKDKWYVNDYNKVHSGFATPQEAIEDYNKIYSDTYEKGKRKVEFNSLTAFNYKKHKFINIKIKNLK